VSFWEQSPPMGPLENATSQVEKQDAKRRRQSVRRPRTRQCLLKGCAERFRPQQARQRYCSEGCRKAARKWSRWKAQKSYRATVAGQQKRNGQSQRYRERVRNWKTPEKAAVDEAARVIIKKLFLSIAATGQVAMRDSCASGAAPCNASARRGAGAPWSRFGSGSGSGAGDNPRNLIPTS
jgi:hypothetical protein